MNLLANKKKYFIGDACLCWSLGDTIEEGLSELVLKTFRTVQKKKEEGHLHYLDAVPSYNALAIHFDPINHDLQDLETGIDQVVDALLAGDTSLNSQETPAIHKLPTLYNGDDLSIVAEKNGLSIEQVINLHQAPTYKVAMVGFLPHFPYLIGLDPKLETPRLDSPRTKIPKGAVAIGGAQTGIYPRESPGGWNIIGLTDAGLLEPINPGDLIVFEQVDKL